ncbi:hypothetical protein [Brevundimonas aurifodinae]|uniref:Uncharacterized protein n=1 Tax=Brevundimonas aurifodinae TaxID=1508312 RepID=A0ABV1NR84_9CAUL|nr:MAG: hypothetical protein B7Z42_01440 [Brevundimonas sp. 12-68-7]
MKTLDGLTQILVGLFIFALVLLGIWYELGLNLLAEAVGLFLTVVAVDEIYARNERKRLRPLLIPAHREARDVAWAVLSHCAEVLRSTIQEDELSLIAYPNARLSDKVLEPIYERIDMNGNTRLSFLHRPTMTLIAMKWRQLLRQDSVKIKGMAAATLNRYVTVVDPKVAAALDEVLKTPVLNADEFWFDEPVWRLTGINYTWAAAAAYRILDGLSDQWDDPYDLSPAFTFAESLRADVGQSPWHSTTSTWRQPRA